MATGQRKVTKALLGTNLRNLLRFFHWPVRGQRAFTAIWPLNSSAIPRTHIDMPYFAIVYAENKRKEGKNDTLLHSMMDDSWLLDELQRLPVWFLNQTGLRLRGGARLRMWGLRLFSRWGMTILDLTDINAITATVWVRVCVRACVQACVCPTSNRFPLGWFPASGQPSS